MNAHKVDEIRQKLSALVLELAGEGSDKDSLYLSCAEQFCSMTDDGQAKFFVEVARQFKKFKSEQGFSMGDSQLCYIADHLNNCECSDPIAIEWINNLHGFLKQ